VIVAAALSRLRADFEHWPEGSESRRMALEDVALVEEHFSSIASFQAAVLPLLEMCEYGLEAELVSRIRQSLVAVGRPVPASDVLRFVLQGAPVPNGRGRASVETPSVHALAFGAKVKVHVRTPKRTRKWEADMALLLRAQMGGRPRLGGCVLVMIESVCPRSPKLGEGPRVLMPASSDVDNLEKSVLDAMQKAGIFRDDRVVVDGRLRKWWAGSDENPHTVVRARSVP
jgi:Holliday junction resolvase RusA-like endonuclease